MNQDTQLPGHLIVIPVQAHEINFIVKILLENGVAVGNKRFFSHKLFTQFITNDTLRIIRIKSHWKWDENYRIMTKRGPVRVVCFS